MNSVNILWILTLVLALLNKVERKNANEVWASPYMKKRIKYVSGL